MRNGTLIVEAIVAMVVILIGVMMVMAITSSTIARSDKSVSIAKLHDFEEYVSQYILRQGISASASSIESTTTVNNINNFFVGTNTSYMKLVKITVEPTITQADITVRPVKFMVKAGNVTRIDTIVVQGGF